MNLFKFASPEDLRGETIPLTFGWDIEGVSDSALFFKSLIKLLPSGCNLYLDSGCPSKELEQFFSKNLAISTTKIEAGTIWPFTGEGIHLKISEKILMELSELTTRHEDSEIAVHFHIFKGKEKILEWHDAFANVMLINTIISEDKIKEFCDIHQAKYQLLGES
jgi:hypothetical protein